MNGKYKVQVCADAVRLDQLTHGYTVISRAPVWDVLIFRPDTHEYAQLPYNEWLKANLLVVTTLWTMELKKPISHNRFEQNGKKFITYIFPSTSVSSGFLGTAGRQESKNLENNRGEIVCLDFPADIHAGGVTGRACALPELQGIALRATRKSAKSSAWTLQTLSIKHRDDLTADLFVLPKGLKKVPFDRSLFSSAMQKGAIEDMFGGPIK